MSAPAVASKGKQPSARGTPPARSNRPASKPVIASNKPLVSNRDVGKKGPASKKGEPLPDGKKTPEKAAETVEAEVAIPRKMWIQEEPASLGLPEAPPEESKSDKKEESGESGSSAATPSRGGALGMLDKRKEKDPAEQGPTNPLRRGTAWQGSASHGTEEWTKQRAFKSKLGEMLRVKFQKTDLQKVRHYL